VLFKGAPLADAHVSFIPRGKTLAAAPMMDPRCDLMTEMDGIVRFTFNEANYHLIVAHVENRRGRNP
jgi:hypothetical protein